MTAYAKNRDIAREIAMSKHSYCDSSPLWDYYDAIVYSEKEIRPLADQARAMKPGLVKKKLTSIDNQLKDLENPDNYSHIKGLTPLDISKSVEYLETRKQVVEEHAKHDHLVFRLMTYRNVPSRPPAERAYRESEFYDPVPFPPYEILVLEKNRLVHKMSSFVRDGVFSIFGEITHFLVCLWMLMVKRIGLQDNWKSYTDIDDYRQIAMMRLMDKGLKFSEASEKQPLNMVRNLNPFSYYTSVINNTFKRCVKNDKKSRTADYEIADHLRHELEMGLPAKSNKRNYV